MAISPPVTIGEVVKYYVLPTDKIINLINPHTSGYYAFHDQSTDTDYQVPVGRKLIILHVNNQHNITPKQDSVADTNNGTYIGRWNGSSNTGGNAHSAHAVVNAGNFINVYSNYYFYTMIGLETDV